MCVYVGYHARTEPPKGPTCFVLESHRFGKKYMELAHWLVQASYARPNVVRFHNSIPFVLSH